MMPKEPHWANPRYNLELYIGAAAAGLVAVIVSVAVYYLMKIALIFDVFQAQWFGHWATIFDIITWTGVLVTFCGFGKLASLRRKHKVLQHRLGEGWRGIEE